LFVFNGNNLAGIIWREYFGGNILAGILFWRDILAGIFWREYFGGKPNYVNL
jgi:hypothetical protein